MSKPATPHRKLLKRVERALVYVHGAADAAEEGKVTEDGQLFYSVTPLCEAAHIELRRARKLLKRALRCEQGTAPAAARKED